MSRKSMSEVIHEMRELRLKQLSTVHKFFTSTGMQKAAADTLKEIDLLSTYQSLGNVYSIREIQVAKRMS